MELETYEANLADIALQEQTFYETKPTVYELQMASQLMSNNPNGGYVMSPGFPLLTPILNNGGKGRKKKSVKFLTYVQVRNFSASTIPLVKNSNRNSEKLAKRIYFEIFRRSFIAWIIICFH